MAESCGGHRTDENTI